MSSGRPLVAEHDVHELKDVAAEVYSTARAAGF